MSKFIVASKGLAYATECSTEKDIKKAVSSLKKLGYKKPLVYTQIKK